MKSGYFGGIEQKIISFLKNAHLPENVHEKTHFHEKSAPKKIRKGSEASEGELTI